MTASTADGAGPGGPSHRVVPVLLIHGQPGRGADWAEVVARVPAWMRTTAPDRPGYDGRPARSMGDNADILADLLSGLPGGPAVVVGHSYGGGIALLLAARHPDTVAGLVLVAPVGDPTSVLPVDRLLAAPVVGPALSAAVLGAAAWVVPRVRRLVDGAPWGHAASAGHPLLDDRVAAALVDPARRRAFVAEQRHLLQELPSVAAAARAVHCPTVVVTGSRDSVVPPRASARLAASVPGAQLRIVAGGGHLIPMERPGAVVAAVRAVCETGWSARPDPA